ncbi:hypothetical protein [Blastococcus atacamensis]|uniref:hypothetical protein n=1 Tax=Blastococcus atacamensis TaxID=2070508 RepID=UPI0012FFF980|nr:hypothetical protein [Blastococcus atacamensis]
METMHAAGRRNLPPVPRTAVEAAPEPAREPVIELPAGTRLQATALLDAGQEFVARLRAAAPAFATAAGARSAVVREVVPPARHRRARCRLVLRFADGADADLTFLGERRRPGVADPNTLDAEVAAWLRAGRPQDPAWLMADSDAANGVAVDLTAWHSRI